MVRQIKQQSKFTTRRRSPSRSRDPAYWFGGFGGGSGQNCGGFEQPRTGNGISLVIVGRTKLLSFKTWSVFPACAEKQIVVAKNKKDVQNIFFIGVYS